MSSMYETIMNLPLFYGINTKQVSRFVGDTHLRFSKYDAGQTIIERGSDADELYIILSGTVDLIFANHENTLTLEERCGPGRVLCAERIFGINTKIPFKAVAAEKTSIMSFRKEEYLSLLRSETIYLVNYVNYLAARAQRPVDIFSDLRSRRTLADYFAIWLLLLTDPKSMAYTFTCPLPRLQVITDYTSEKLTSELKLLESLGYIAVEGDIIHILDRSGLIERSQNSYQS